MTDLYFYRIRVKNNNNVGKWEYRSTQVIPNEQYLKSVAAPEYDKCQGVDVEPVNPEDLPPGWIGDTLLGSMTRVQDELTFQKRLLKVSDTLRASKRAAVRNRKP